MRVGWTWSCSKTGRFTRGGLPLIWSAPDATPRPADAQLLGAHNRRGIFLDYPSLAEVAAGRKLHWGRVAPVVCARGPVEFATGLIARKGSGYWSFHGAGPARRGLAGGLMVP